MPAYDYICTECSTLDTRIIKYEERDYRQECNECGGSMLRTWVVAPSVRTPKTSKSFVAGVGRPGKEGRIMDELKKIAGLEKIKMNTHPDSTEHKDAKREIRERKNKKTT